MNIKRLTLTLLALLIAIPAAIIGWQLLYEPGSNQASPPANPAEQLRRGAYLARAGNCMACHTAQGGPAYAGGRTIATPFGGIATSNLTPDQATGLGSWTADDFWRAMHNGKSKDGSFLYPAFPYPSYTKVSRADSDAIYAHLRTLPAVHRQKAGNTLRFPYNQRIVLAFWRTLYFTPGQYQASAEQSAAWNRGAYLVQGLGHCAACHTERNALGGSAASGELAGGAIPMLNWHASSLASDPDTGLGRWDQQDIAELLKTGVSRRGAVFGPMSEVVGQSLQHLSGNDIDAMALYLKSLPARQTVPVPVPQHGPERAAVMQLGARLYEQHCVACHKADGKGEAKVYPALAGQTWLTADASINPIRLVLNGGYPPSTGGNPQPFGMPPFGAVLDDREVAALVTYIGASWGNQGRTVLPQEVARLRGAPAD
jgi:mono/diheme cytochrome c family protein